MAKPYRYVGHDARDYPSLGFGAAPGDIVYLTGLPPDERFVPHEAELPTADVEAEQAVHGDEQAGADWRNPVTEESVPAEDLKQPNKAAPAADWTAFAEAHGGFEQATGTPPADATRKAIVDHYADNPVTVPDQRTDTEREADENAALGRKQIADAAAANDDTDDASKEV